VFKELTTEEIEVRVWATIVLVLAAILLISVVCHSAGCDVCGAGHGADCAH
jgi:hypothetical protein